VWLGEAMNKDRLRTKKLREQWKENAGTLLRFGDILIRVGIFATLVYGIYYAMKLFIAMSHGATFVLGRGQPYDMLVNALITFLCMGIAGTVVEHQFGKKKFRLGGIMALAIGAVLLVIAQIAGLILILGGFITLLSVELRRPANSF
jgi:Na+/melibiose symporter-like transporter